MFLLVNGIAPRDKENILGNSITGKTPGSETLGGTTIYFITAVLPEPSNGFWDSASKNDTPGPEHRQRNVHRILRATNKGKYCAWSQIFCGEFLDANVYKDVLGGERPWKDPCESAMKSVELKYKVTPHKGVCPSQTVIMNFNGDLHQKTMRLGYRSRHVRGSME